MSTEAIEDIYICKGSVNGDVFLDFVLKCLLPKLMPFNGYNQKSIIILDNASIHKNDNITDTINGVGSLVQLLPPYSPDLNPIESVFAQVKQYLKANNIVVQNTSSHELIITTAFCNICKDQCISYIKEAGYHC